MGDSNEPPRPTATPAAGGVWKPGADHPYKRELTLDPDYFWRRDPLLRRLLMAQNRPRRGGSDRVVIDNDTVSLRELDDFKIAVAIQIADLRASSTPLATPQKHVAPEPCDASVRVVMRTKRRRQTS